ncbi:hypothetical protein [Halobacterium hubeiense]|uniref:hypothetical protein n=1 Tax=Halobacterium hubeiense TaxID=1407499 RepID=UPI003C782337
MSVKSVVGRLAGWLLLAVAGVAALNVAWMVASSALWGVTTARFLTGWFSAGLALTAGLTGYVVRQRVAGNVIPLNYDVSVAFRGGQGGL